VGAEEGWCGGGSKLECRRDRGTGRSEKSCCKSLVGLAEAGGTSATVTGSGAGGIELLDRGAGFKKSAKLGRSRDDSPCSPGLTSASDPAMAFWNSEVEAGLTAGRPYRTSRHVVAQPRGVNALEPGGFTILSRIV
jgi:hypothetical protein